MKTNSNIRSQGEAQSLKFNQIKKKVAKKSNSDSYRTIVGHFPDKYQVQRIVQRELPRFAGVCGFGEKKNPENR